MARVPELRARRRPGELRPLPVAAAARRAVQRVVEYAPGKLVARRAGALTDRRGKRESLSGEHRIFELRDPAVHGKGARQLLKILVQGELVVLDTAFAL